MLSHFDVLRVSSHEGRCAVMKRYCGRLSSVVAILLLSAAPILAQQTQQAQQVQQPQQTQPAQQVQQPQQAQPAQPVVTGPGRMTLKEMIKAGGWLMHVLTALSVIGLALVVFFLAVLRGRQVAPPRLVMELLAKIREGDLNEARHLCEFKPCAISAVTFAALQYLKAVGQADPVLLKDIMEGEGRRQAESILGPTQYLLDVGAIAPMVGLLGTVFGMIQAFSVIAYDIAKAKPIVLAQGVAMALITTAYGLLIGIPAMMFYAYFRRRGMKVVSRLESASTEILTALHVAKEQ